MNSQITIVVFGIIRAPEITLPSLRCILDAWKETANADIIFSLFDLSGFQNPRTNEVISTNNSITREYGDAIEIIIPEEQFLKSFKYPKIKHAGNYWGNDWKTLDNIMRQLYCLKLATTAAKDTTKKILFIRGDLLYETNLIEIYNNYNGLDIGFVSPGWQRWENGFNDRFYYVAGRELISAVGERLDRATEFCEDLRRPFHPEQFLKYCVTKTSKKHFFTDERAYRVRSNGEILKENFDPNWKFQIKKNIITETFYRKVNSWNSSV